MTERWVSCVVYLFLTLQDVHFLVVILVPGSYCYPALHLALQLRQRGRFPGLQQMDVQTAIGLRLMHDHDLLQNEGSRY